VIGPSPAVVRRGRRDAPDSHSDAETVRGLESLCARRGAPLFMVIWSATKFYYAPSRPTLCDGRNAGRNRGQKELEESLILRQTLFALRDSSKTIRH